MVINNNKNKKYIEITGENIIFYKWYGKKVLKREKIRAAYMDDNYVIRILYGKSIRRYNISNISGAHKVVLEKVLELMNEKNILFYRNTKIDMGSIFLPVLILNIMQANNSSQMLLFIILLVLVLYIIVIFPYYYIFIYDLNKDEIILEAPKSKKIKKFKIGVDEVGLEFNPHKECYIFKYKWRKIQIVSSNIVYPKLYKSKIEELSNYCLINSK